MRRTTRTVLLPAVGLLALGAATAPTARAQYTAYGVATNSSGVQQLVRFNTANPTAVTTIGATGANLIGLDFRPSNGVLYGYNGTTVFTVDLGTGAATALPITAATTGANAGFDFNPVADAIRITAASGTNLRYSFALNTTFTDTPLAYAAGDAGAGQVPSVTAVAYTNSFAGTASTTLYGIDAARGTLVTINPPNNGTLNTVGSLGLGASVSNVNGFDIVSVGGANLAFFSAVTSGSISNFYSVNLTTGAATLVGSVGAAGGLQGLAITAIPEPGTWALMAAGLAGLGAAARRRTRRQTA